MNVNPRYPDVGGWLEVSLSSDQISKLHTFIEDSKNSNIDVKNNLVGNITSSLKLVDTDNWFFENVCINLIDLYSHYFPRLDLLTQNSKDHPLFLDDFWVNFQKQTEFNPIHNHSGLFSFVIWIQIPTSFKEQHEIEFIKNSKNPCASDFHFMFTNILGQITSYPYYMDKFMEGKMLFFPSSLNHTVYPFFENGGERISISGNICYNSDICKDFDEQL